MKVTIANVTTDVLAYQGQKVCTTKQLAEFYGCGEQHIRQNFLNNSERFDNGKHFFKLEGDDLKRFKRSVENFDSVQSNVKSLLVWTEKGAARHAKMLSTDRAWDVFELLEDTYFAVAEMAKSIGYEGTIPALVEDISSAVMNRVGGMVKAIIHKQNEQSSREIIESLLPDALDGLLAVKQLSVRKGLTTGQIIELYNLDRIKGLSSWLSHRLRKLECEIGGKAEMGGRSAWLFDPDKVSMQMKLGGLLAQSWGYIKCRRGQSSLNLS